MNTEGSGSHGQTAAPKHEEKSLSKVVGALLFAVIGQDIAGRAKAVMWTAMTLASLNPELSEDGNRIAKSASGIEYTASVTITTLAEVIENPVSEAELYQTIGSLVVLEGELNPVEEELLNLLKNAARASNVPPPALRIVRRTSLGKVIDALARAGYQYTLKKP